jgi:hypothetical protein
LFPHSPSRCVSARVVPTRPNSSPQRRIKRNRGANAALVTRAQSTLGLFSFADPFPPRKVVEHTYAQNFSVSGDGSVANKLGTAITMSLNDIFAPGGSYTHQPYGRDQMAALYGRYKVHGVVLELEVCMSNTATTKNPPVFIMGINAPSSGFTYTGALLTDAMEQASADWIQVPAGLPRRIVKKVDVATLCGATKQEFAADVSQYCAANGSSPTKTTSVSFSVAGLDTSVYAVVALRFTYRTEWFERITLAAS